MSPQDHGSEGFHDQYAKPLSRVAHPRSRSADRTIRFGGYLYEYHPGHPEQNLWGYVLQHRLVAEHVLGRYLFRFEVVHHEDLDKTHNSPSNLWLFPSHQAHMRHHKRGCPRYSAELASRLRPLAEDPTVSLKDAGCILEVDAQTVRAILDVHGIPWVSAGRRHLTEDKVRRALEGRTTAQAAKVLGVSHGTLRYSFQHLLETRASPGTLERRKEEIHSLATELRGADLAKRLGVCPATVKAWIARWRREEPDAWSDVLAFQLSRRGLGRQSRRMA